MENNRRVLPGNIFETNKNQNNDFLNIYFSDTLKYLCSYEVIIMNVNEYKFKILSSLFTIINIIKIYFRYKFMNKVIFIFFILLTSKTYGNDNLSGNKIICVNDYGSVSKLKL